MKKIVVTHREGGGAILTIDGEVNVEKITSKTITVVKTTRLELTEKQVAEESEREREFAHAEREIQTGGF